MQVVVTGFGHSGTAAVASELRGAGLPLGGHGEPSTSGCDRPTDDDVHRVLDAVHARHGDDRAAAETVLHHVGVDQWRALRQLARTREVAHDVWGFADPLAVSLLGVWKHVLPDARFVLVFREPRHCVASLTACDGEHGPYADGVDAAVRRWCTANRSLVSFARAHPDDCVVVDHADLVQGKEVAQELRERLGVPLRPGAASRGAGTVGGAPAPRSTPAVDPVAPVLDPRLQQRLEETWTDLLELGGRSAA
ncbi:sulfotransferase [Nocardioides litoris]|uniref:sulfotransferase n=1 Tax=Nocardioides litoris TaxID=1926648 RepID=UPI00111D6A40|nr:sulfotransferase [Nocardioides litoris]